MSCQIFRWEIDSLDIRNVDVSGHFNFVFWIVVTEILNQFQLINVPSYCFLTNRGGFSAWTYFIWNYSKFGSLVELLTWYQFDSHCLHVTIVLSVRISLVVGGSDDMFWALCLNVEVTNGMKSMIFPRAFCEWEFEPFIYTYQKNSDFLQSLKVSVLISYSSWFTQHWQIFHS